MLNPLLDKFKESFRKDHSRSAIKNSLLLVLCILERQTACLYKLANEVPKVLGNKDSQPYAHYKRLIRLFANESDGDLWSVLLSLGVSMFGTHIRYLVMDGTQWQFGQVRIHLAVLSVVYRGVSIPVYWIDLRKKGSSGFEERKQLIQKAGRLYRLTGKILLADREYIGKEWFLWLKEQRIRFVIRIQRHYYRHWVDKAPGRKYRRIEKAAMGNKKPYASKRIMIGNEEFLFIATKNTKPNAKEPLVYLLSTLDDVTESVQAYGQRWMIECCFKHLKTNGFNLEDMNLKDPNRIRLMVAIVVFAYCLCIHEGFKKLKSIKKKRYASGKSYWEKSIFRTGLDRCIAVLDDLVLFIVYLANQVNQVELNFFTKKKMKLKNVQ